MAGYIFLLDSEESLKLYAQNGVYATKMPPPNNYWRPQQEGIFGDYATMQAGDNIYFFIQRKIYGIGKLINVGQDCKYFNYPDAAKPKIYDYGSIKNNLLWDEGNFSIEQRCLCLFEPDPYFFINGVDMDDVLFSNPPAFKMLRALWKLSFIKFDDDENQAFRDIIIKRNHQFIQTNSSNIISDFRPIHKTIETKVTSNCYDISSGISEVLSDCAENDYLRHEMAIEAGTLCQIAYNEPNTKKIFGCWDYLSRQVVASPFKPIDYMDKMDLFGYSYVPGFKPTKSLYLIGEIKRYNVGIEAVDQILKYVDWVKDEYCFGDYSMINAFLIGYTFDEQVAEYAKTIGTRGYTIGMRPTKSLTWSNLRLVQYRFNKMTKALDFLSIYK